MMASQHLSSHEPKQTFLDLLEKLSKMLGCFNPKLGQI